ncbi:hypothetical protein [Brevibacillus gelatini]
MKSSQLNEQTKWPRFPSASSRLASGGEGTKMDANGAAAGSAKAAENMDGLPCIL